VNEALQLCLDYDFWIRLGLRYRVHFLDRYLASSRVYRSNKTLSRLAAVYEEAFAVVKQHFGWLPLSWALAGPTSSGKRRIRSSTSAASGR